MARIFVRKSGNIEILFNIQSSTSSFAEAVYIMPQEHIVPSFVIAVSGNTSHFDASEA